LPVERGKEGIKEEAKVVIKEEAKEEESYEEDFYDECETFPDSEYPTPPVPEEQIPNDHPRQDDQEAPPEDVWFFTACGNSPCQFIQWQEELVRIVDIMHPEASNMMKRFHMYHHMTCQLHGPLRKGKRRQLHSCFEHGLRDLNPSDACKGYKPSPFNSGPLGDHNC
jgi:hypothetical protein